MFQVSIYPYTDIKRYSIYGFMLRLRLPTDVAVKTENVTVNLNCPTYF